MSGPALILIKFVRAVTKAKRKTLHDRMVGLTDVDGELPLRTMIAAWPVLDGIDDRIALVVKIEIRTAIPSCDRPSLQAQSFHYRLASPRTRYCRRDT